MFPNRTEQYKKGPVSLGKFLNYLSMVWASIWLIMVPAWKLLWFYTDHIKNPDSSWPFLWGVLFWVLGAIVVLVGIFIVDAYCKYIGLDDK